MRTSLSNARKYAAYALAGAALGAPSASGAIIGGVHREDPADTVQSSTTTVPYDINEDGINDYELRLAAGTDYFYSYAFDFAEALWTSLASNQVAVSGGLVQALEEGDLVGPALTYGTADVLLSVKDGPGATGYWSSNLADPKFIALRFQSGTDTHYGWVKIGVSAETFTPQSQAIVYEYAYETSPDTALRTSSALLATPEPSSMTLFALGAAGLAALKRRRR